MRKRRVNTVIGECAEGPDHVSKRHFAGNSTGAFLLSSYSPAQVMINRHLQDFRARWATPSENGL